MGLRKVRFEVFGRVQGVYFRACTKDYADSIGVKGWVRNTNKGTVEGEFEGEDSQVEQMKHWLRYVGSAGSSVSDARFEESPVNASSFSYFNISR